MQLDLHDPSEFIDAGEATVDDYINDLSWDSETFKDLDDLKDNSSCYGVFEKAIDKLIDEDFGLKYE